MNPLISVIIPIYKVELYLEKCVESVLVQSYKNIELILVDDGSPDTCPSICDAFVKSDNRVKVIHKENGGLSDARNAGLKVASGDFVIFLDGDDFWEGINCLENIRKSIIQTNSDIILFGCKDYHVSTGKIKTSRSGFNIPFLRNHSIEENIEYLFKNGLFPGAAWLLAVKRKLLLENDLFFTKGIKAEDYDWLINLFLKIKTIDAVPDCFYIYRYGRPGSITKTADQKSVSSLLYIIDKWYPILLKETQIQKKYFLNLLSFIYVIALLAFSHLPEKQYQIFLPEIKQRANILKYARDWKTCICKILVSLLGVECFCKLLKRVK